jgi:hypothetical protein
MITRILLLALSVGIVSTVLGCTFDFVNLDAGVGGGISQGIDPFYKNDPPFTDNPWGDDWPYTRGGSRRYGQEP